MTADDDTMNRLFRALGDTTRRQIIEDLAERDGQSLFELYMRMLNRRGTGPSRQGFSRHLVALEEAGIIDVEWQGTTKLHKLNKAPLTRLGTGWLARFTGDCK